MESLKWILIHHNQLLESIRMWILTSCCSHLPRILLQLRLPFQCRLRSVHWSNAPTGDCQQAQKARIAARRFSNILFSTVYLSCSQGLHCQHAVWCQCLQFASYLSVDLFSKAWSCRVIQDGTHNPLASASQGLGLQASTHTRLMFHDFICLLVLKVLSSSR